MNEQARINDLDFYKCVRHISSYSGCSGWDTRFSVVGVFAIHKEADREQVLNKMMTVFGLEKISEYLPNTGDRIYHTAEPIEIKT